MNGLLGARSLTQDLIHIDIAHFTRGREPVFRVRIATSTSTSPVGRSPTTPG
jgi:hypothetical protein